MSATGLRQASRRSENACDEGRFAICVSRTVVRVARGQLSFQLAIFGRERGIAAQRVAKADHPIPGGAVKRDDVNKVRAWVTFAEDLVTGNSCPCRMLVTERHKRVSNRCYVDPSGDADKNVQDRLCRNTRNARAAAMLDSCRERVQRRVETTRFLCEQGRPAVRRLAEPDLPLWESQLVSLVAHSPPDLLRMQTILAVRALDQRRFDGDPSRSCSIAAGALVAANVEHAAAGKMSARSERRSFAEAATLGLKRPPHQG